MGQRPSQLVSQPANQAVNQSSTLTQLANLGIHSLDLAVLSALLQQEWNRQQHANVGWPWLGNMDVLREIGRRVVEQESQAEPIPGHMWVVVRMDANAYDQEMRDLRHDGVLESHNSPRCASCMTSTLKTMMQLFSCVIGFAHHSELVFVVPPTQEDFHMVGTYMVQNNAEFIKDTNVAATVSCVWYVA